jgi:hypothetical protein
MAGRLDVITYGENDKYLTLDPEKTFFHTQVTKRPNFAVNFSEMGMQGKGLGFGKTVRFTIPQNSGHLLKSVTLSIKADDIPKEWNLFYQDGAGVGVIEYADLIIGGNIVERLDSNYITIEKTYFNNSRQQETVENLTGIVPQTTFSGWYGCRKSFSNKTSQKSFDFQIELPFYFCKTPELALPICALHKQEVEVEIKFRDLKDILFSKMPDLYGEDCSNFPIPTYYDENWIRTGLPIFLEFVKGWDRTVYSYFKYNKTPLYDNTGASMTDAFLGRNGLAIHRGDTATKFRDWYPYSESYGEPSWSMFNFLRENGSDTYDGWNNQTLQSVNPEFFVHTPITKVIYNSFPTTLNGTISMRVYDGDKEYSKNVTLKNPYTSLATLEVMSTVFYDTTTYRSFAMEKTSPNLLRDVYNHEIEAVYGGSANPFTDIGTQNELAVPYLWKKRGLVAVCNVLGVSRGVRFASSTSPSSYRVSDFVRRPEQYNSFVTATGVGYIRIYNQYPVGEGYNDTWNPDANFTHSVNRIKEIEELEGGSKTSSDVISEGLLELHAPMHSFIQFQNPFYKHIGAVDEPIPGYPNPSDNLPVSASAVNFSVKEFGKVTRISSAGKAIVASLGYSDAFTDLRVFTWHPNKRNGGSGYPGYSYPSNEFRETDRFDGERFQMVWPNSRIDVSANRVSTTQDSVSDFQLSDYWETTDFGTTFLDGRTAVEDNGHFALFWGHVRNITIPYSYVVNTTTNDYRGFVQIYQWNFNDWSTYQSYVQDWEKQFSIAQTIYPPDTPTYNYNFGQKLCISRTSQMLIVSEPHWVPPERQSEEDKLNNIDWNVGRVHIYKRIPTITVTSLNITVDGGKFYINGVQQDTLELHANKTYTFDQSDPSNAGHPLKFSTMSDGTHAGGTEYTTGVTGNGNAPGGGQSSPAIITFIPPLSLAGTTIYYYCQNHSGMGGSMNVTTSGGSYTLHQTIYPELPSYSDRLKRSIDLGHGIYTSWNDPIQKRWEFGRTMDLSDDDKTLIIGADSNTDLGPNEAPNGTSGGWVSVYQLNDSGAFEFKSILNQKLGDDVSSGFASSTIAVNSDGNDIAVSADTADWNPDSELPFPDTTYDPQAQNIASLNYTECGNIQLFSRDTKTPRNYRDVDIDMNTCKLKMEMVYLDKHEEVKIKNTPATYIITQLQRNSFNWREYEGLYYDDDYVQASQKNQYKLNFCNPVKELFIITKKNNDRALQLLQDSNTNTSELCFFQGVTDFDGFVRNYGNRETNNVFTSSKFPQPVMESLKSVSLKLDDEDVIPVDGIGEFPSHFLRAIPASKYHTHTSLNRRVYMWSFGINPEDWKPTGQLNFSTVKNQLLSVEGFKTGWTHQHDLFVYARSYNVMKIDDGVAHLLYPLYGNGKSGKLRDVNDFPNPNINELLVGNETITHERTQNFVDPGIALDPDFTFESSNNLDINTVGTYRFDYNIVSEHGIPNHKSFSRIVNVVDTTAPVISLNFPEQNPIELIFNTTVTPTYSQPYVEFGAVADTGETVTITIFETDANGNNPVEISDIDTERDSYYNVTYSATDSSGNTGTAIRRVIVKEDADAPIVTLNVPSYNNVELFYNIQNNYSETYTEYGASATDIEDGSLSVTTTITRAPIGGGSSVTVTTVDPVVEGFYTVTYSATDTAGNVGTAERFITVIEDTVAPVITLNGANPVNLIYNDTVTPTFSQPYVEFGATSDGGEVVTIDSSAVNETTAGTYTVNYSATDRVGNIGTTTRTVIVTLDADAPTVTLNTPSYNPVDLVYNSTNGYSETYTEYSASATDATDGTLSVVKTVTRNGTSVSDVDPIVAGTYTVRYTATDTAGNEGFATRTVTVVNDTVAPVVTLNGSVLIKIVRNYSGSLGIPSPPVTVSAPDQNLPVVITDPNSRSIIGTYYIVYTVTDRAQNIGSVSRQVNVYSTTTAPSFSLIGGNQTITECESYTDPGYQNVNFEISNTPTYSTNLNTSLPGTYTASWTSTSPLLGSTQTTTLSRTVTVNAISFTPNPTADEAFSYYEPIADNSGYTSYNLRISDSTDTSYAHPAGDTVYRVNRRYRPTCNNNDRASRIIFRHYANFRYSAIRTISSSLSGTFNSGTLGGSPQGTAVLYHTLSGYNAGGGRTSGGIMTVGNLSVTVNSSQRRYEIRWNNGQLISNTTYISVPSSYINKQVVLSVTGKVTRTTTSGVDSEYVESTPTGSRLQYRAKVTVTHGVIFKARLCAYNGTATQTPSTLQSDEDWFVLGSTSGSGGNVQDSYGSYYSTDYPNIPTQYGNPSDNYLNYASAQADIPTVESNAPNYAFFDAGSTTPNVNFIILAGSNSSGWTISDGGSLRTLIITDRYSGTYA